MLQDFSSHVNQRRSRWKATTLEVWDIYHAGCQFDAASAGRPGAANRASEVLRAMLKITRQRGKLGENVPDACANITRNTRRPIGRYLDQEELRRLGAVLDRHQQSHPWRLAALRLLGFTEARLSEGVNLRWDEIGALAEADGRAREDRAAHDLARAGSAKAARFASQHRGQGGVPRRPLRDSRAFQGVMNGVCLPTVGKLLGHRRLATTALHARLDDNPLQAAAEKAAGRIANRWVSTPSTRTARTTFDRACPHGNALANLYATG